MVASDYSLEKNDSKNRGASTVESFAALLNQKSEKPYKIRITH